MGCDRITPSETLPALVWPQSFHLKNLSQDFAEFFFFSGWVTSPLVARAMPTDPTSVVPVSGVEQAFAGDEVEDQGVVTNATPRPASTFVISELALSAFHRDARFGGDGGEDAVENAVILGVVLCGGDRTSGSAASLSNVIDFSRGDAQPSSRRTTVSGRSNSNWIPVFCPPWLVDIPASFQRGVLQSGDEVHRWKVMQQHLHARTLFEAASAGGNIPTVETARSMCNSHIFARASARTFSTDHRRASANSRTSSRKSFPPL